MKRFVTCILTMVMCAGLIACGGDSGTGNQEQENYNSDKQTVENTTEEVKQTEVETETTVEEINENVALYIGKWTDDNYTLTVNEDGTCNIFIKEGYVKGEPQTDISVDLVWDLGAEGALLVIDEAEGGYNEWILVEKDGEITLYHEGSQKSLRRE